MSQTSTQDRRPQLLVVDDEPANLQVLRHILQEDYRLLFAKDGAKALELAAREKPELILLDVMMPGMTGYQVCAQLKATPATSAIPVIFVTALADVEDEAQGFAVGAVEEQPDLFSDAPDADVPRPVPGSAAPRQKAALVRVARALFDDPSSAPLHPDFVCHSGGAEAAALPWGSAVAADLVAVDALGSDAALVRARVDGALVALVWVQLPAGWCLRFLG